MKNLLLFIFLMHSFCSRSQRLQLRWDKKEMLFFKEKKDDCAIRILVDHHICWNPACAICPLNGDVTHFLKFYEPSLSFKLVRKGDTIWNLFHLTSIKEALRCARLNSLPLWYKHGKLIVKIVVGQILFYKPFTVHPMI